MDSLSIRQPFRAEQQRQPPQHLEHPFLPEYAEALAQPNSVDRPQLRDIHDRGSRKAGFAAAQAHVAGHVGET